MNDNLNQTVSELLSMLSGSGESSQQAHHSQPPQQIIKFEQEELNEEDTAINLPSALLQSY